MASERWRAIEAIFGEVAALPAGERADCLTRRCGGDEELRREIESLLAADAADGDFLEQPPVAPAAPPPSVLGRRFGPYSVERQLGEGGMSTVYLAVRADGEYRRQVAVKVFAYGAERADLVERFRAERQILASLDHPNIPGLLDGGTADDGLPYLVMEYVDGIPIDRYCDERRLSVGERIDMFRQVCAAVQHAHRNLVVHRDIKPSNILVTPDGVPHLLDFGIAKILGGSPLPWPAAATTTGQRLMTPHYASPEQVEGKPITTVSDVYSLGVLLYVLLAGRLPYRWEAERVGAIEQAVVEQQSERPSAAAGSRRLARQLAGDLDNIVLMALRKEPARRYASVALLSEDLRRHRAGLPVLARPATVRYRMGKFVLRHRPGSAVRRRPGRAALLAAAAALALVAGSWLLPGEVRNGGARPHPGEAILTRLTDLPGKEWFPSLTPDGNILVYARKIGDRSRLFLRRVGGDVDLELLPGSEASDSQPAVSPNGQQIAFRSERDGGGIFVMGLMGESVRRVTDFGFNPAWSPDGTELAFATEGIATPQIRRYPSQLYRVHLATGELRLVHAGDAVQPSWSPHGHRLAYWSGLSPSGERALWTIPVDGGNVVRVTDGRNIDWNPVWAPDGRSLYFASDRSGVTNLWRLPIDESSGRVLAQLTTVATSGQASMLFSLSRDGRRIAYASDETRTVLEKVAFDVVSGSTAGPAVEITQTSHIIATIDASQDGRWLVFKTSVPQEDLFVVRTDGTGLRRLTDDRFKDRQPRWSPDGTRIAFYSNRGGSYEIWTIRADGSGLERVVALPGKRIYHPIWSPDGGQIACDLAEHEALLDLTLPLTERRPQFLAPVGPGLGFSASSWSADGRWLAGALHEEERQLPGVVLYSLASRKYERITNRGQSATWLSDSRHLLYWYDGRLFLLDTARRTSRQVLATLPGSDYNDFSRSPDDRFLYLARNTEQGDIWMLTLE